jgi:hypothetical protein
MEKVFSNDILKVLAIALVGSIGAYMFLIKKTRNVIGSSRSLRKRQNLYLLLGALLFPLAGVTAHDSLFTDPGMFVILYEVYFLALGILHVWLMMKMFPVDESQKAFGFRFVFTLTLSLFGFLLFVLVFRYFNRDGYQYLMGAAVLFFLVPVLVYQAFLTAIAIPPAITKKWLYPVHQRVEEPNHEQLKNMFIVTFQLQKKLVDPYYTSFRAKAPAGMEFGSLFYYFINDYNERNPADKLEFMDDAGNPQGWTFYKKGKWYHFKTQYLDANKAVSSNKLKENDVIICHRIH